MNAPHSITVDPLGFYVSHRRRALKLSGPSLKHKWSTNSKGPAAAFPGNLTSQVGTPGPARPRPSSRPPSPRPPTPAPLLSRRTAARARIKMASCPASVTSGSAFTRAFTLARGSLESRAPGAVVGAWACVAAASPPGASSSLGVPLPAAAAAAIPTPDVLRVIAS